MDSHSLYLLARNAYTTSYILENYLKYKSLLRRTSRSCIGKKRFFFITDSRCPERPVAWSVQQYQEIHLVLMYPLRQCSNESSMSAYTYDLLNEFWHAFWLRKRALTQGLAMYYRIDNTDNTLQYIFSSLVPIFIQYY